MHVHGHCACHTGTAHVTRHVLRRDEAENGARNVQNQAQAKTTGSSSSRQSISAHGNVLWSRSALLRGTEVKNRISALVIAITSLVIPWTLRRPTRPTHRGSPAAAAPAEGSPPRMPMLLLFDTVKPGHGRALRVAMISCSHSRERLTSRGRSVARIAVSVADLTVISPKLGVSAWPAPCLVSG